MTLDRNGFLRFVLKLFCLAFDNMELIFIPFYLLVCFCSLVFSRLFLKCVINKVGMVIVLNAEETFY